MILLVLPGHLFIVLMHWQACFHVDAFIELTLTTHHWCCSVSTGQSNWHYRFITYPNVSDPFFAVTSSHDAIIYSPPTMYMIDGNSGLSKWNVSMPCDRAAREPVVFKNWILRSCEYSGIDAINVETGQLSWHTKRLLNPGFAPAIRNSDGLAVFPAGAGKVRRQGVKSTVSLPSEYFLTADLGIRHCHQWICCVSVHF